ncbi:MAG: hypothetical protein HY673_21745 [Chloroflexi bacterium]|nr:hypothetical protein [Chloroflexota bacterium]
MRRLLYVPILHTETDLGSMAPSIGRQSMQLCGEEWWNKHCEVLSRFWQTIADYLLSLSPPPSRLYQDGLPAGGEAGLKVIEAAAQRGSPNYSLVLELVKRGVTAEKTEDPSLLLMEFQNLLKAIGIGGEAPGGGAPGGDKGSYASGRDRLMRARDEFIARTINETLKDGETGVLFLGAYHDVQPLLAADVSVREVKDLARVRAYFKALLSERRSWESLADYLCSPVSLPGRLAAPPGPGGPP